MNPSFMPRLQAIVRSLEAWGVGNRGDDAETEDIVKMLGDAEAYP